MTYPRFFTCALILLVVMMAGCQPIPAPISAAAAPAKMDVAKVHVFGDAQNEVAGATSTLERRADRVVLSLDTVELAPGEAYTIWWVIFNNSTACAGSICASTDLSNPDVQAMVGYATGAIADESGAASFSAILAVGDNWIALDNNSGFPVELLEPAPGLIDPSRAEIHVVVRTHGTALDDPHDQLTTFGGGCNPECKNVQAAVHSGETPG